MEYKELIKCIKEEINHLSIPELMSMEESVRRLINNRRAELGYYDSELDELAETCDGDSWSEFLKGLVNMNNYDEEAFIHDVNNLRGDEWIEILEDYKLPDIVIEAYKKAIKKSD